MKNKDYNRDKLIQEFLESPLQIGDLITTRGLNRQNKNIWGTYSPIVSFDSEGYPQVKPYNSGVETLKGEIKRLTHHIGYNPIKKVVRVDTLNYSNESMLNRVYRNKGLFGLKPLDNNFVKEFNCVVEEHNFNPFVYVNGEKYYYQRDFVWTIEQCQNLIESIYNNIDCGRVLVRERSWEQVKELYNSGEKELFFGDIVDGKQRLTALYSFIMNIYPDKQGYYWDDLCEKAQYQFLNKQSFSYAVISDKITDEEVLEQFLITNFSGVPQSTEHLDYVRSILNKVR